MVNQRWREKRATYRPSGEPIVTSRFEVAPITGDAEARAFVTRHHYSGSYPAARERYGLFRSGALVGVAVLSHPASEAALEAALPLPAAPGGRAELGRFVLLDEVPANGESWFLARVFELARKDGYGAVVAHSDPEPRKTRAGELVFPGHIGTIYQATNATYCGRTPARTWRLFDDGTVLSARAISKLRSKERGHGHVVELLMKHGARWPEGDWRSWVRAAVESTTSTYRHRGTHRYVWALDRKLRKHLPEAKEYPKFQVAA